MKTGKAGKRNEAEANPQPKARTAKQMAAEQEKAARLLVRETEQNESGDRFTSLRLIRAIEESFGKISVDPCWHEASAVRPDHYLDVRQGHNGLRDHRSGRLVFVSPPWSNQGAWIKRAFDQWLKGNVGIIICLVPAATDARFFHKILAKHADVYFVEGRPHFSKTDGSSEGTMRPTMIVMFGANREQKARFAARVSGSWWLPDGAEPIRADRRRGDLRSPFRYYGPVSCAATSSPAYNTVICGPSSAIANGDRSIGSS
ncbi:MAG: DNA N-6-adenine-methyltransferase [Janthinobacterium lividum]